MVNRSSQSCCLYAVFKYSISLTAKANIPFTVLGLLIKASASILFNATSSLYMPSSIANFSVKLSLFFSFMRNITTVPAESQCPSSKSSKLGSSFAAYRIYAPI
ncbi:hypothetical protein FLA_2185 [Filimonas lacunae]|nr:hypothetical protein FLA_2185 [Filimonas lacunae]